MEHLTYEISWIDDWVQQEVLQLVGKAQKQYRVNFTTGHQIQTREFNVNHKLSLKITLIAS